MLDMIILGLVLKIGVVTAGRIILLHDSESELFDSVDVARKRMVTSYVGQINGTKFDPWILGSAVIAGCQTGAVNGLTQFKSETAILDNNEIRKVLKGTRLTLEALQHDLVFKQDNQSQLAAWDFRGHVAAMMDLIKKSELQDIFDLDALRRYQKNVKPIFLKFSSYFHKRHPEARTHLVCRHAGYNECESVVMEDLESIPEIIRAQYREPCVLVMGDVCAVKPELVMSAWVDALESKTCSESRCDCDSSAPCVVLPGTQGQEIGLAEVLAQQDVCVSSNTENPEAALERSRRGSAWFAMLNDNFGGDELGPVWSEGIKLSTLKEVAKNLGGSTAFDFVTGLGSAVFSAHYVVTKASAILCRLATTRVLRALPETYQQVVVNAVQPIFWFYGKVISVLGNNAKGVASSLANFFGIPQSPGLSAGTCRPGQVAWFTWTRVFESADNSYEACLKRCEQHPKCVAFDYSVEPLHNACRGVTWNVPRIGREGPEDRVYCQVVQDAATWTRRGQVLECKGYARISLQYPKQWSAWKDMTDFVDYMDKGLWDKIAWALMVQHRITEMAIRGKVYCEPEFFGLEGSEEGETWCQCNPQLPGEDRHQNLMICDAANSASHASEEEGEGEEVRGYVNEGQLFGVVKSKFPPKVEMDIKKAHLLFVNAYADSICSDLVEADKLYHEREQLGECNFTLSILPGGVAGQGVTGLPPNARSATLRCSDLNPEYEGEYHVQCSEGPGPFQGYRSLPYFIQKNCKRKASAPELVAGSLCAIIPELTAPNKRFPLWEDAHVTLEIDHEQGRPQFWPDLVS